MTRFQWLAQTSEWAVCLCVCSSVRMCVPLCVSLSVPLPVLLSVCPSHSCLLYHTCKISDKLTDSRKMQCSLRLLSVCLSVNLFCHNVCHALSTSLPAATLFWPPSTDTKKDRSWAVKYLWFYSIVGCGWDTWFIARTSKYFEQKFNFTLFQVFPSISDFANFGTLTRTLLWLLSKIVWQTINNW